MPCVFNNVLVLIAGKEGETMDRGGPRCWGVHMGDRSGEEAAINSPGITMANSYPLAPAILGF